MNSDHEEKHEEEHQEIPIKLENGKFFFFGCWNRRDNDLVNHCNDNVVNEIIDSEIICGDKYDFGVILGDNIYPDTKEYGLQKEKKKKKENKAEKKGRKLKPFTPNKMVAGMTSVDRIPVPLHIVLGNHDIENCEILGMQMVNPTVAPVVKHKHWSFTRNLYSTLYSFKKHVVRLIVIDTNVINDYIPNVSDLKNRNYYNVLNDDGCAASQDDTMITDPKLYYSALKDMLLPNNNRGVDLIIIAGHEPLACVKEKEKEKETNGVVIKTKVDSPSVQMFLNDIMDSVDLLRENNIETVYICADIHAFLDTTIIQGKKYLRQIVAGTGGAIPDIYTDEFISKIKSAPYDVEDPSDKHGDYVVKAQLKVHCVANSYGYCAFDLEKFFTEDKEIRDCDLGTRSIMYRHNVKNTYDNPCFAEPVPRSEPRLQGPLSEPQPQEPLSEPQPQEPLSEPQLQEAQAEAQYGGHRGNMTDIYMINKRQYEFLKTSFNNIL
jgi:hypothetical protein